MPTFCIHHLLHIEVSGSGEAIEVIKEFLSEFSVECHHPADTLFVSSEYDESQPAVKILSSDYRKNSGIYRFENSENGLKLYVPSGIVNQQEARHHVQVLMRFALISQELSLVKAAALSHQGRGILVSGIRSSGKTSAALLPLFDKSFRFLSDDTSIIGKDGTIWSFPRQLLLRSYQFDALPRAESDRYLRRVNVGRVIQFMLRIPGVRPLGELATNWLRVRYPAVWNSWIRDVANKDQSIFPSALFSTESLEDKSQVDMILFIQEGKTFMIENLDDAEASNYLTALNLHYGIAPLISQFALAGAGNITSLYRQIPSVSEGFVKQASIKKLLTIPAGSPGLIRQSIIDLVSEEFK